MAGWKLRKDKAQAETPSTDPETSALAEPEKHAALDSQDDTELIFEADTESVPPEAVIPIPSDWLVNGWQEASEDAAPMPKLASIPELDPLPESRPVLPQPDFESDDALHFVDDDTPLTLVDYSEDVLPAAASPEVAGPETTLPETADTSWVAPEPTPVEASSPGLPPLFATAPGELSGQSWQEMEESDDQAQTLRMNRAEIAAAFPASASDVDIPTVAPFVLDTPLPQPAPEAAHRLVVQIGRLSAPFELTKDVMVIGRPDSNLQSYPDVEIEMDDAVSRRHAEVIKREDGYYVSDTGSTNGTLLNGALLPPHVEHRLTHGDRIRVGERTEIVFE